LAARDRFAEGKISRHGLRLRGPQLCLAALVFGGACTAEEAGMFELRLADDQDACEAVCRAVGCLLCLAGAVLGSANAAAQMESPPARQPQGKPAPESSPPVFTEEREAAVLTFVRKNRPELLAMLEGLKLRRPADYQRAVSDLFRTSEMLTTVRRVEGELERLRKHHQELQSRRADLVRERMAAMLRRSSGKTTDAGGECCL
jgi:hypothetical protein